MSQRSDISASIQTNFPDNASQFITPTRLRDEQYTFLYDTVLNEQTASIIAQAVASSSVGGSSVTTASFNAYTASTNAFTGSIQTQVNALQAATGSYITNAQTSSMSVLSASFASSSVSASYALTASFALNAGGTINTGSFATTGSNTFNGTNTFTGSVNIQSASITFLTVDTIVSSSTIFSSGSNTLGDAAGDTQTLFGTVDIKTGPLKVSGSADVSGSLTVNGNSVVLSNQTGSFVTSAITGSSLITASVSLNTITFTEGDGSTFNITVDTGSAGGSAFPFTGSAAISGTLTIENPADVAVFNLTQGGTSAYSIIHGGGFDTKVLIPVNATSAFSGSGNNAYRFDVPAIITDKLRIDSTVLNTAASILMNPSGSLTSNVTESKGVTTGFGNIIFNTKTNATLSGSYIVSGAANILYYAGASAIAPQGFIGNNNNGLAPTYSGSVIPNFNNNVAPSTLIVSASSPITIASNFIAGASNNYQTSTTATSSFSFNVLNGASIKVNALLSGSSTGTSVGINNNNLGGAAHLIQFEGSSSVARNFSQNIIIGNANTASLTSVAGASITTGSLLNTAILGSNLIVSGTMSNASLSASVFVGQYNETGSLADPTQVKFAVGAGTTNAARLTPFYVSASGDIVIKPNTTGIGRTTFGANITRVGDGVINGAFSNVATGNGVFVVNQGTITAGQTNVLIAGEVNTITAARSSAIIAGSYNTINTNTGIGDTNNLLLGTLGATISGSQSRYTGIFISSGSVITGSTFSAIIAGNAGTTLNNTTSSVALGRDTAYVGNANYTLYTQNIDASGSVSVTGSATVTGDVKFASGSNKTMGTFVLDGGNPGVATVSNSLVSATSLIFLTKQTNANSGNGTVSVTSKGTGTFSVTSNHNGDTDTVAYLIINPA